MSTLAARAARARALPDAFPIGTVVRYHGSLVDQHGAYEVTWVYADPDNGRARFALAGIGLTAGINLQDARRASVTLIRLPGETGSEVPA